MRRQIAQCFVALVWCWPECRSAARWKQLHTRVLHMWAHACSTEVPTTAVEYSDGAAFVDASVNTVTWRLDLHLCRCRPRAIWWRSDRLPCRCRLRASWWRSDRRPSGTPTAAAAPGQLVAIGSSPVPLPPPGNLLAIGSSPVPLRRRASCWRSGPLRCRCRRRAICGWLGKTLSKDIDQKKNTCTQGTVRINLIS